MRTNFARVGAYVCEIGGSAAVAFAGWELRHWLGIALAGVLVVLIGVALEREVS